MFFACISGETVKQLRQISLSLVLIMGMAACGGGTSGWDYLAPEGSPEGNGAAGGTPGAATANPGGADAAGGGSVSTNPDLPATDGETTDPSSGTPVDDSNAPTTPTDPGTVDGPEDVAFEGEPCVPKTGKEDVLLQSNCDDALACLPDSFLDMTKGHCRIPCFTSKEVEGGWVERTKKPELCPAGRSCLSITSEDGGDEAGDYCVLPQDRRDAPCRAVGDEAECGEGMSCLVTNISSTGPKTLLFSACKPVCDPNAENPHAACESVNAGEICSNAKYSQELQKTEESGSVSCTMSKCDAKDVDCECHLDKGFQCTPYIPGIMNVCLRSKGWCGKPVAWLKADDLGESFTGEICNEVESHDYCDHRPWEGVENPGSTQCVGISNKNSNGICFAACSFPSLDRNGDGKISEDEQGKTHNCPAKYTCSKVLGRKLGMLQPVEDKTHVSGLKPCDASKCTAGEACLEECGAGDAECLDLPQADGTSLSACAAPYGNCEPEEKE